ncbi:MAG TPA: hypothetical protein VMV18_12780, partial [bacterium]|nr:hypothetical protein [bacterium]
MRGLFSGAVGFAAGGLCVLSVLGAPAGAASSSPAAKFWRENAPTATPVAAESLPSLAPLVKA